MTETPADIIAQADEALQDLETVLASAVVKATEAVNANPSAANLKALEAAKQSLADHRAQRAAEIKPEEKQLKNIREVASYLQAEGWKISERKAYDDKHLIKRQKDGTYLVRDADEYAERFLQRLDGTDADEGLAAVKLQEEINILKEKREQLRRRNEIDAGKWIRRGRVESMLAERAAFLCADLDTFIHNFMPQLVEMCGGNTEAVPEMIAFGIEEKEKWLDRYAQPVPFMAPVPGETEEDAEEDELDLLKDE
jgi:hypothetical protein